MARRLRNSIVAVAILLFLILGGYFFLQQNGWVWDPTNWKMVKTGGIYLSFVPHGAQILVDGTPYADTTSFLSSGILIQRLPPKPYAITLKKPGFYPWEKTVAVTPGKVAAAHDIFLWPKNPPTQIVGAGIKDFWITREGLVLEDAHGQLRLGNQLLRGTTVELSSSDSGGLITRQNTSRFFIDLQNPETATNLDSLFTSLLGQIYPSARDTKIDRIFFHPFSHQKLLITTKTALYNTDLKKIDMERVAVFPEGTILSISSSDGSALTPTGDLLVFNLILKTFSSSTLSSVPSSTTKISTSPNGIYLLLETKESGFFVYDRNTEKMTRVTDAPVAAYTVSPEGKRLAMLTEDKKLTLYYLAEYEGNRLVPKETRESVSFPFLFSSTSRILWLPHQDAALLLNSNSAIGLDMDFRSPLNTQILYKNTSKNDFTDTLLLLKENGELLSIDLEG
ncbi:MAG: PEGA domain-containing protein [Patescibacteria group bacterium]